jgi:hypothetical protein
LADEGKKRNADLREGYRIALDPNDWLANNEKLARLPLSRSWMLKNKLIS